jgi:thiol:disulfide interchange protein
MKEKIGLAIILGLVMLCMGGIVIHDFVSNDRLSQITGEKNSGWEGSWSQVPVKPIVENNKRQITASTYQEAIKLSGQHGVPVLIIFEADWCGWCKKMKKETLADVKVKEAMKNYILVIVDTDKNRTVAAKFGVQYLPAYAITNVQQAKLKSGGKYKDAKQFVSWLNNPNLYKQPNTPASPPIVAPPEVKPPDNRRPWRPNPPSNPPGGG